MEPKHLLGLAGAGAALLALLLLSQSGDPEGSGPALTPSAPAPRPARSSRPPSEAPKGPTADGAALGAALDDFFAKVPVEGQPTPRELLRRRLGKDGSPVDYREKLSAARAEAAELREGIRSEGKADETRIVNAAREQAMASLNARRTQLDAEMRAAQATLEERSTALSQAIVARVLS